MDKAPILAALCSVTVAIAFSMVTATSDAIVKLLYRSAYLPCISTPPPSTPLAPWMKSSPLACASSSRGPTSPICHDVIPWVFNQVSADSAACDARSEEHTSELQSRFDLVCRLLLEKKKNTYCIHVMAQIFECSIKDTNNVGCAVSLSYRAFSLHLLIDPIEKV